jgi:molecular chaperone GrpE (heat shock protein)
MSDTELSIPSDLPVPVEPSTPSLELQSIIEQLELLKQSASKQEQQLNGFGERLGLIPAQLRELGNKVENVTENINQARLHDFLQSLLLLLDLTSQFAATADANNVGNYELLRQHMLETLEINGIHPIDISGRFDPACHRIVERIPCDSPEEDGQIASVYRPGFRTARSVLRYAEVMVKFYSSPNSEDQK